MEASDVNSRLLVILFLAFTVVAEARSPRLPLMPDREAEILLMTDEEAASLEGPRESLPTNHHAFVQEPKRPSRSPDYSRVSETSKRARSGSTLLGFELGTIGRSTTTSPDALGLKLMWGGRAFAVLPMGRKIYLKPSLGFFYRKESSGKVSISEHSAEGGINLQYAFSQSSGFTWYVGASNRVDVAFSRTSISALEANPASTGSSDSSAPLIRYRVGPSLGFTYRLSPEVGLLFDAEVTLTFTKPIKPFGGFVGGAIFRL